MSDTSDILRLPIRADDDLSEVDRSRMHWPINGLQRIASAARALRTIAGLWDSVDAAQKAGPMTGCIDPASAADSGSDRVGPAAAELDARIVGMRGLADEFASTSRWLSRSAAETWQRSGTERPAGSPAAVLGESHRLICRDWMCSDMNAQHAMLLRLALRVLAPIEPTPAALRADLRGSRAHGPRLRAAADLLARTAVLGAGFARFVDEAAQHWSGYRLQLEREVAGLYAMAPVEPTSLTGPDPGASRDAVDA